MSGNNKDSEVFIGLVAPVGVNLDMVEAVIKSYIHQYRYKFNLIKMSNIIKEFPGLTKKIKENNEFNRIDSLMTAGNEIRKKAKYKGIILYAVLSAIAISEISKKRKYKSKKGTTEFKFLSKQAHVISSLKHPDEVMLFRYTYSHGFFLLGVSSSEEKRKNYLVDQKGMTDEEAEKLIKRDQEEVFEYGQHTRDVFQLADGFIDIDAPDYVEQIGRILDLLFGNPYITPTPDEYAMYLAYASSLRSADLSRQVGALVMSESGEVISAGTNDVPRFGGGLYWSTDKDKCRDIEKGVDSNQIEKDKIVKRVMAQIVGKFVAKLKHGKATKLRKEKDQLNRAAEKLFEKILREMESELSTKRKEWFKETGILDITEYGRAVHAEMEALLSCARVGVSPRAGTLYTTTFPCHNCAKHIVASGIKRVVFVEPYPKSKAKDLHDDSVHLTHENNTDNSPNGKVMFVPFVGVGYRRFFDLFSMKSSTGITIKRKDEKGEILRWKRNAAYLRVPLLPISYIDREAKSVRDFLDIDYIKEKLRDKKKKLAGAKK